MILRIDSDSLAKDGIEIGPFLEEFIRTTVTFSVWHQEPRVDSVDIHLELVSEPERTPHFRCMLRAGFLGRRPIASGATGSDLYEAVQEAANLLEVALRQPPRPLPPQRLDAPRVVSRRRAPGLHSGTARTSATAERRSAASAALP
ncbi:MAG: hypothetical protein QNK05_17650 [Myxococcota bacterium]|nr:hypothetical protein [Myxococcota bacterium]